MTNTNHMLSVDSRTEKIWIEAQYQARMHKTTLSAEVCKFIVDYHEKATRPIEVKDSVSVDSFKIMEGPWLLEEVNRLSLNERAKFSRELHERTWEYEHIINQIHSERKKQQQYTNDKKKHPIQEKMIELKEEVVVEEVVE